MISNKYIRKFVSFTGKCPYMCNHCYTFCSGYDSYDSGESVKDIISNLKAEKFDVVYISGHKENFVNEEQGLELCEKIYYNFHTDIMVTTRNVFSPKNLDKFNKLNKLMKSENHNLFFCASIPALESYQKLEPSNIIPDPYRRIENLKAIYDMGIFTFLTLRPLCPDEYIPIKEILDIIDLCKNHTSIVLSSGIVVNDDILSKLDEFPKNFKSQNKSLMPCLKNDLTMKYVDVHKELNIIKNKCNELQLPFFEHSMPAIDLLIH